MLTCERPHTYMCSILTKGSTCRKNKNKNFLLILIEQGMTNLLKKKRSSTNIYEVMVDLRTTQLHNFNNYT